jgi:hypothetical protein
MNITLFFFISLTVCIIGLILAIFNIVGRPGAALFYALGGMGTVGFGIAWIVTYLKHA